MYVSIEQYFKDMSKADELGFVLFGIIFLLILQEVHIFDNIKLIFTFLLHFF